MEFRRFLQGLGAISGLSLLAGCRRPSRSVSSMPGDSSMEAWKAWLRSHAKLEEKAGPQDSSAKGLIAWQKDVRQQLASLLHLQSLPPPGFRSDAGQASFKSFPLEKDLPGIRGQIILPNGIPLPYLLLGKKGPKEGNPPVICLHGHGAGWADLLDPSGPCSAFPMLLEKNGFAAICPLLPGFGPRIWGEKMPGETHRQSVANMRSVGLEPFGYYLWETLCLAAWVRSQWACAPGIWGWSLGGAVALCYGALAKDMTPVLISSFLSSHQGSFLESLHCPCVYVPGLAGALTQGEILAACAPRPVCVQSFRGDRNFPWSEAARTVAQASQVYRKLDASENLVHQVGEGGHQVAALAGLQWLKKQNSGQGWV
jgi:pimeloyl-ACP methyl ester carboxylesterase